MILGLLNWLSHVKMYTKIDLCEAYNLMHVRKGDKWKTTLWTHYGHFKYVVMPFDLRNAHVILQHLMNYEFFDEYLDDFVVCYINHIFIFLRTWKMMNDMYVLFWTNLWKSNSTPNWKNMNFTKPKWNSLVTSSLEIIHMDLHKLWTIMNWVTSTSFCDVQCFHGFVNFYLHFIVYFSQ
jgi:hypothetical protein